MNYVVASLVVSLCVSAFLMLVSFLVGKPVAGDREKASPYECGFESMTTTRTSFSVRFFLVGVIFLVFDLEAALFFPVVWWGVSDWAFLCLMGVFLGVLGGGLAHEWSEGSLMWGEWWN